MTNSKSKVRYVSPQELREEFNRSSYQQKVDEGLLQEKIERNTHLKSPENFQGPFCTHSQVVYYLDYQNSTPLAVVHRYLRPDNSLGASGKPDPKRLKVGDEFWAVRARKTF